MVNKKGWLRIFEATLAIMLILSALIVVVGNRKNVSQNDLTDETRTILEEIAKNSSLRTMALDYDVSQPSGSSVNVGILSTLNDFARNRIGKSNLNQSIVICAPSDFCNLVPWPNANGEVYSSERILSSDLASNVYAPKKLKIYLWRI